MKIKKGVLTLFLIAALSVAQMPAMAVEVEELLTDEQLYELEYERLLIEGYDDETVLLSLDDQTADRTWSYNGGIYWNGYKASPLTDNEMPATPQGIDWQGSGNYRLGAKTYTYTINPALYLEVSAGTYCDYVAPSVYAYQDGKTLDFTGTVRYYLACTWFNANAFVGTEIVDNVNGINAYPQRMAILVNGDVVTSVSASDSEGTFDISYKYEMNDSVTSVGYRFYFDTTYSVYETVTGFDSSVRTRGLYFFLDDNAFVTAVEVEQYVPLFKEVITEVKAIPSTIYNFFFGDDGDSASSAFKSSVDSAISSGEAVRDEFSQMEKPEPEDIVPDVDQYAPLDQYTAYTDTFGALMENDTIVSLMMVSLGFAFLGYVFFGKRA